MPKLKIIPQSLFWIFSFILITTISLGAIFYIQKGPTNYIDSQQYEKSGDYTNDADIAITEIMGGNVLHIYKNSFTAPLMMPGTILLRGIPISGLYSLGFLGKENLADFKVTAEAVTETNIRYTIGLFIILITSMLVINFSLVKRSFTDKKRYFVLVTTMLFITFNPVTLSALHWGHPEELMLSALVLSALAAIYYKQYRTLAVLAGLIVSVKQPGFFIIPTLFFAIPSSKRLQAIKYFLITIIATVMPWILLDFNSFIERNFIVAGSQDSQGHGFDYFSAFGLNSIISFGKPLLLAISLLLPVLVLYLKDKWQVSKWQLTTKDAMLIVSFILLFRCVIDSGNILYYSLPFIFSLFFVDFYLYKEKYKSKYLTFFPIPILSIVAALLLDGILPGNTNILHIPFIYSNYPWVFLLFTFPMLVILLLFLFDFKWELFKKPQWRWGSLLSIILFFSVSFTLPNEIDMYKQRKSFAYLNFRPWSPDEMKLQLEPYKVFWVGEKFSDLEILQKVSRINHEYAKKEKLPLAIVEYWRPTTEDVKIMSIFSYPEAPTAKKQRFNKCYYNNNCLPDFAFKKKTDKGRLIVLKSKVNSGWEAQIITPNNQFVYIIDNGTGTDPEKAIDKIDTLYK